MPFSRKVRWIWSNSALLSGLARSTPAISAPRAWESGLTVRGIGSPKDKAQTQTVRPACPTVKIRGRVLRNDRRWRSFSVQRPRFSLPSSLRNVWHLLRDTVEGFIEDDALSRGASIAWRDVIVGALVTAGLFEGGKYVIALYIGKSDVASSYGAAGALIILLLWIFYSAQIFLLGAEFTRAFARRYGTHAGREVSNPTPS